MFFYLKEVNMLDSIPGLANVPETKSSISSIDGPNGILAYRGYSIQNLCERSSFEKTELLLKNGELPNKKELREFKDLLQKNTK